MGEVPDSESFREFEDLIFGTLDPLVFPGDLDNFVDLFLDLFDNWHDRLGRYTLEEQNRVIWRIIGSPFFIGSTLIAPSRDLLTEDPLPIQTRAELIRKAKSVTLSIPLFHKSNEPMETGFFMWWDMICENLVEKELVDAALETLSDLIEHEDERVQFAALHGLGHLDHPLRAATVHHWMDRNGISILPAEERRWYEECRDGTVM